MTRHGKVKLVQLVDLSRISPGIRFFVKLPILAQSCLIVQQCIICSRGFHEKNAKVPKFDSCGHFWQFAIFA